MLIPGISCDDLFHIITLTASCKNEGIQSLKCRTFRDDGQLRVGAALACKFQTNTPKPQWKHLDALVAAQTFCLDIHEKQSFQPQEKTEYAI